MSPTSTKTDSISTRLFGQTCVSPWPGVIQLPSRGYGTTILLVSLYTAQHSQLSVACFCLAGLRYCIHSLFQQLTPNILFLWQQATRRERMHHGLFVPSARMEVHPPPRLEAFRIPKRGHCYDIHGHQGSQYLAPSRSICIDGVRERRAGRAQSQEGVQWQYHSSLSRNGHAESLWRSCVV
jgi:hypothetical protein